MVSTDELPAVDLLVQRLSQGSSVWEIRGALLAYVAVVTALEAENAALRKTIKHNISDVVVTDANTPCQLETVPFTCCECHASEGAFHGKYCPNAHGIPLPGEGVEG